jgi:general secretion pathway protein M
MIGVGSLYRYITRHAVVAAVLYVLVIAVLGLASLLLMLDIGQRYSAGSAALETLARMQDRKLPAGAEPGTDADWPSGSPFLDGSTVTLASAALLQRITSAIARAGGTVVSSEVEPRSQRPSDDYVKATAICEVSQVTALQQMLHDLEAGMPFLFIDQLVIEAAPQSDKNGRMRVRLAVSGLWPGAQQ